MSEHFKNEKDGQLHYEANISYDKFDHSRTLVSFNPQHNLKLIPRYLYTFKLFSKTFSLKEICIFLFLELNFVPCSMQINQNKVIWFSKLVKIYMVIIYWMFDWNLPWPVLCRSVSGHFSLEKLLKQNRIRLKKLSMMN